MKTVTTIFLSIITLVTNAKEIVSKAEINNNTVAINWTAEGNSRFEIERSFYSNNFTIIASLQVPAAAINNFMINDNIAELAGRAIVYYRVKQTAANGTVSYSNTMVVNLNNNTAAEVKNNNTISFTAAQNGNAVITVKCITGNTASVKNTIISKGANTVELNSLTKGVYTATVSVNGVVIDTQKVIAE
jgi:hypothetical protein